MDTETANKYMKILGSSFPGTSGNIALSMHAPDPFNAGVCGTCRDVEGDMAEWPCPTAEKVLDAPGLPETPEEEISALVQKHMAEERPGSLATHWFLAVASVTEDGENVVSALGSERTVPWMFTGLLDAAMDVFLGEGEEGD